MKYITTLFWGFILGQVAYYLGSQLSSAVYNFQDATILGIVISVTVFTIAPIMTRKKGDKEPPIA